MLIDDVRKLCLEDRFVYWTRERYRVWCRRRAGLPGPWTDDEILRCYRFCNVRRMDDRVSQWLLDNWYKTHLDHPNMLIACVLARHFNLPSTLQRIGFPVEWEPDRVKEVLRGIRDTRGRTFNGAYVIASDGSPDKALMVIDRVVQPVVDGKVRLDTNLMEVSVERLVECRGFGSFMAGQVVADARWGMSGRWSDRNTWAPVGPGSRRGMNRLHGRPVAGTLDQRQFVRELQAVVSMCQRRLFAGLMQRLEAMDYQNCLCEWDKYERCLWGEGAPKQRYSRGAVGNTGLVTRAARLE